MGKAAESKQDQLNYLKQRTKLLAEVVSSINPDEADLNDVNNISNMINDLQIKVKRFTEDWETK